MVSLIGPNGAGKTTLVRVLLGLIDVQQGTVARKDGLTVGYMPQRMALHPALPLTVMRFLSLSQRATEPAIAAALTVLRIEHLRISSSQPFPAESCSASCWLVPCWASHNC